MTCIVGLRNGDRVWLGADRAAEDGWTTCSERKLFRIGGFLFGCSGPSRLKFVLQHRAPRLHGDLVAWDDTGDAVVFMNTVVVDGIRDALRESGMLRTESGLEQMGTNDDGCQIIAGCSGHIFVIDRNFGVMEMPDYAAAGSGEMFALGALYATEEADGIASDLRVQIALRAAERHGRGVRGPFDVESVL